MTVQINCRIPDVCLESSIEVSAQVLRRIPELINEGLMPVQMPAGAGNHSIRVPDELAVQLDTIGKKTGLVLGRVVGGLLYAKFLQGGGKKGGNEKTSAIPGPLTENLRPGQVRCVTEAAPLLAGGKILISECGTGSGKSRIIAHAAAYVLSLRDAGIEIKKPPEMSIEPPTDATGLADKFPDFLRKLGRKAQDVHEKRMADLGLATPRAIILSAPSVENIAHLAKEWESTKPNLDPRSLYKTSVVLGRGQFVSESRLVDLLADSEDKHPQIEKWIHDGMPAGQIPSTKFLLRFQPELKGLMADLEHLAMETDFPCSDAAMDEDSPTIESTLYYEMRKGAFSADIVLTTHAMLCMDNMRLGNEKQGGLLPPALALFVDEAHLLESTQANMAAKSLSFQRLMTELRNPYWASIRKGTLATEAVSMARDVIAKLIAIPNETSLPISSTGNQKLIGIWNDGRASLKKLELALGGLCKGIDKASNKDLVKSAKYIQRSLGAIEQISLDHRGHIEHTPRRGCISFVVGPTSVDRHLLARWSTTPCAMVLSGTLHQVGQLGGGIASSLREMCIPLSRGVQTTPSHPSWVTGTPTIYQPSMDCFHRFMPPSGDDINDLSLAAWLLEVARVVNFASKDAAGGMLVLMTGYERLEILDAILKEKYPSLSHRIIAQTRSSRLTKNIPKFKEMARSGLRPIWLATGSAWVGLDLADETLSDKDATKDIVLTDLVMPNLPFGLNKSTTHVSRSSKLGFGIEVNSAQRLFRQGLGRGVRRDNLLNRRYWVLDGRLVHPSAATHMSALRKVLTAYLKRKTFDI